MAGMKRKQHELNYFAVPAAITFAVLLQFTIRAKGPLLVYWLRGSESYDAGMRAILEKSHSHFSDGQEIPHWAELCALFAAFISPAVPAVALYLLLNLAYKLIRLFSAAIALLFRRNRGD
jgi:hypothetical protein